MITAADLRAARRALREHPRPATDAELAAEALAALHEHQRGQLLDQAQRAGYGGGI